MAEMLELKGLAATRPSGDLLGPLDLQITQKDITGFIGPTGCGRHDLFDILAGLRKQRAGSVSMSHLKLDNMSTKERKQKGLRRNLVDYSAFSDWTLADVFLLDAVMYRSTALQTLFWPIVGSVPKKHEIERMLVGISTNEIHHELNPRALIRDLDWFHLSVFSLTCMLAYKPKILLLEQLFSKLNHQEQDHFVKVLRKTHQKGMMILIADDQLLPISHLCKRVVVMAHGYIIADGPPEDIGVDPAANAAFTGIVPS